MTQQDETGQVAVPEQSGPVLPSPYLDASEASPQAYLAPARPDQPKYGTLPPFARQDYFQQRPDGQPGDGPGPSRPFGLAVRRDPALAAPWERLGASFVDWIIIYAVSALPYWSSLLRIEREMQAIMVNSPNQSSPAAQAAVDGIIADPSTQHVVLFWFLTFFGLALAYYWVQHAAWGATVGKRVLGIRVVRADDQARIGVKAAGIRTVAFLVGPAMLLAFAPPVNVAGGVLWVADTGLTLLDPRAQCLHDKLAGTLVMKKRWLDQQARSSGREARHPNSRV